MRQLPLDTVETAPMLYSFSLHPSINIDHVIEEKPYIVRHDDLGKYCQAFFQIDDTIIEVRKRFYSDDINDLKNSVSFYTSKENFDPEHIIKNFNLRKRNLLE
mgnify:CR=1 FL=1